MNKQTSIGIVIILFSVLCITALVSAGWPTGYTDWLPLYNGGGGYALDPQGDSTNERDVVGDVTTPAAYLFNDGTYIYYRIRLNKTPWQSSAQLLSPFGWGFLVDTDQDAADYEWMVMADGITDTIFIAENTTKTGISNPSDKAETVVWTEPLNNTAGSENFKYSVANSTFGGDADYFLDFRFPLDVWLYKMGLTNTSVIRYFVGTSNQAQTLTSDLVGAATLSAGLSNEVIPSGQSPTTGTVRFVTSDYSTDLTQIYPGNTIYIRVEDMDVNSIATVVQTLTVTVTAPSGDSETVTLTETGASTGIFTGSISTSEATHTSGNGNLELEPIESVTVTYVDGTDAAFNENQSRYDTLTVRRSANLQLTKTVSKTTPNVGDTISYTLLLKNLGTSTATGIQVKDLLPSGVTYLIDNSAGAYNYATGIWFVSILNNGASKALVINATVNSGTAFQSISNFANIVSSGQYDPITSNNNSTATITIQGADIKLTKTVNNNTPNNSTPVIFTITAKNLGTNNATGLIVNDVLPTGLTFSSYGATNSTIYNSTTGKWGKLYNASGMVGFDLNVNQTEVLTLTATVAAAPFSGFVTNFTNSIADQADPDTTNNRNISVKLAIAGADLSLSKSVNIPNPNVGQNITYTVTLLNKGNNTANTITVNDLIPSTKLTYVSSVPSTGAYNSGTGNWTIPSLASGATATLTITATVKAGQGGQIITNTANITASAQLDPVTSNNTASKSVTVQSVDIKVTKVVDNTAPNPSSAVKFTVTVQNIGVSNATNLVIKDSPPTGLVTPSYYPSQGSYASGTGLWSVGTLNVGASATFIINGTSPATSGTKVTNTALLNAVSQEDINSANNSASASFTVGGVDIEMSKYVSNASPVPGNLISFIINATNKGPFTATNLNITDVIPSGLTYSSHTPSTGTYYTSGGNKDHWLIPTIAVNDIASLTIYVTVDAGTNGRTLRNTARFNSADQSDIDQTNNIASVDVVVGSTDVQITKIYNTITPGKNLWDKPTEGDLVRFTITLNNLGAASATGMDVQDLLPSEVTFANYSATNNTTYNATTGLWNATNGHTYSIAPSGSAVLFVNATVNADTGGQTVLNQAQIINSAQPDPVTSNNYVMTSFVVQSADLSIAKFADDLTPDEESTVLFTITLTNNGPHDAHSILVKDLLPTPELTYINDDGVGAYSSATGIWNVGTLAKLSSVSLNINAKVSFGTGLQNITNIANIVSADEADSNTYGDPGNNNEASLILTPRQLTADLDVTKISNTASINEKQVVRFTINVENLGPDLARSVIINDVLPAGLTYHSDDSGGIYNTGTGQWSIGNIPALANATLILNATCDSVTADTVRTNFANVVSLVEYDDVSTNDYDSVSITVLNITAPDLKVTKTVSTVSDPVYGTTNPYSIPGAVMEYTVKIENNGDANAESIRIDDDMTPLSAIITFNANAYGSGVGMRIKYNGGALMNIGSIVADGDIGNIVGNHLIVNSFTLQPGVANTAYIYYRMNLQ